MGSPQKGPRGIKKPGGIKGNWPGMCGGKGRGISFKAKHVGKHFTRLFLFGKKHSSFQNSNIFEFV